MGSIDEVKHLLVEARSTYDATKSRTLFEKAINMCKVLSESDAAIEAGILKSQALAELAYEENRLEDRVKRWEDALEQLKLLADKYLRSDVVQAYGLLAVDYFQDDLIDIDPEDVPKKKTRFLRQAKAYLDKAIQHQKDAHLLACKSSILRHLAICELNRGIKMGCLQESIDCSDLATRTLRDPVTLLERGLSEWVYVRNSQKSALTDDEYKERLGKAEDFFTDKLLVDFDSAQLALVHFYRLTFRPVDACETFERFRDKTKNFRRLLRECYLYAESTIQLWYGNDRDLASSHLIKARDLLEEADTAGYRNARLLIALAFVRAILEDGNAGNTVLNRISLRRGIDWAKAFKEIAEARSSDSAAQSLVLGIHRSSVWTRLGTFAWEFLKDEERAEFFYRTAAEVLGKRDPIALTNLARFLMSKGDVASLLEAEEKIQKAQNFSDRRFTWWRVVYDEILQKKKAVDYSEKRVTQSYSGDIPSQDSPKKIKNDFHRIKLIEDPETRGFRLEKIIYRLSNIAEGIRHTKPSYRYTDPLLNKDKQIDLAFECDGKFFKVECRWREKQATDNDIALFKDRIDVFGMYGLFISMSGFEDAVQYIKTLTFIKEKVILLLNGVEVQGIINKYVRFDNVIRSKLRHFYGKGGEYYHITGNEQDGDFF